MVAEGPGGCREWMVCESCWPGDGGEGCGEGFPSPGKRRAEEEAVLTDIYSKGLAFVDLHLVTLNHFLSNLKYATV